MLLAVDTGNTQTHIGIFRRESLIAQWRTSTEPGRTADELGLIFQQFLALVGLSVGVIRWLRLSKATA